MNADMDGMGAGSGTGARYESTYDFQIHTARLCINIATSGFSPQSCYMLTVDASSALEAELEELEAWVEEEITDIIADASQKKRSLDGDDEVVVPVKSKAYTHSDLWDTCLTKGFDVHRKDHGNHIARSDFSSCNWCQKFHTAKQASDVYCLAKVRQFGGDCSVKSCSRFREEAQDTCLTVADFGSSLPNRCDECHLFKDEDTQRYCLFVSDHDCDKEACNKMIDAPAFTNTLVEARRKLDGSPFQHVIVPEDDHACASALDYTATHEGEFLNDAVVNLAIDEYLTTGESSFGFDFPKDGRVCEHLVQISEKGFPGTGREHACSLNTAFHGCCPRTCGARRIPKNSKEELLFDVEVSERPGHAANPDSGVQKHHEKNRVEDNSDEDGKDSPYYMCRQRIWNTNIIVPQDIVTSHSCSEGVDLATVTSPWSSSLKHHPGGVNMCGHSQGGENVFFIDLMSGQTLEIKTIQSSFDTVHSLRWGGGCPGHSLADESQVCADDSDGHSAKWTNTHEFTERVYYVVDAYRVITAETRPDVTTSERASDKRDIQPTQRAYDVTGDVGEVDLLKYIENDRPTMLAKPDSVLPKSFVIEWSVRIDEPDADVDITL